MKPERKAIALTDEAKTVLSELKKSSPILLNALKERSGLSNKKWDKAIKELTKNKLASVKKPPNGILQVWLED